MFDEAAPLIGQNPAALQALAPAPQQSAKKGEVPVLPITQEELITDNDQTE